MSNHTDDFNSVTFRDIAADENSGITFHRVESARDEIDDQIRSQPSITFEDLPLFPFKPRGVPGIAIFDYDNDGDEDIYVSNGPGAANSLYSNQFQETGELTFIDVAEEAGVAATNQDSAGVSYGDIDNDGDADLLVLGGGEPNRLFENQGDGTFIDITETSGIGGGNLHSSSASMGDVNGDGLLDIVVGNNFNWENQLPILTEPFALNEHNQLFINRGNNVFEDVSETSGIRDLAGLSEEGQATITHAIAMVDYDLDGDLDIVQADDQAAISPAEFDGVDRGYIQILNNDGSGNFTNVTIEANLGNSNNIGAWMGLSFGDFNSDGYLDIFGSNFGDILRRNLPPGRPQPNQNSRWFLGQADGTFTDPGVGELDVTPFGWGTSAFDYDNDADTDIIFHGAMDLGMFVDASNPGALLENDGQANFSYNTAALENSTDHTRRNIQGVAVGDLNNDGFVDIVSASNFDFPDAPLVPFEADLGNSPFDETAVFVPTFNPTDNPEEFVPSGLELPDGTLSVEVNSADNDNSWVSVETLGTVGLTNEGVVNRDGIGTVVSFTPEDGQTAIQPILGGSSYASQDSLTANFGLGSATSGTVEILWPGGVRNRLYDVQEGEQIVFPEIPVSFDGEFASIEEYQQLVDDSISELVANGVLTPDDGDKFFASAVRAFMEENDGDNNCEGREHHLLLGTQESDTLAGTENNEYMYGRGGDDLMTGGDGYDVLLGGDGNDRLSGDGGSDLIYSGAGSDTLVLAMNQGSDIVVGWEAGVDHIELAGGLTFDRIVIEQNDHNTLIRSGEETLAVLAGIAVDTITETTFTEV